MSDEPEIAVVYHEREDKYLVRFRYVWNDEQHDTIATLGPAGVEDLSTKLEAAVRAHARPSKPPPEVEPGWWKVESRAGHRVHYARGRTGEEAHRASPLSKLHPAEVTWSKMADGFEPEAR